MFRLPGGRTWNTGDTEDAVREAAIALGELAAQFGGASLRIGGATDLRDAYGPRSAAIIKQRGRWASDCHLIYERALAHEQLEASALMMTAAHPEIEAVVTGWAQPALRC